MKNKKFMFFENFLEAIGQLPEEERAVACYEFCKYGISGELPKNKYLAMFCLGVSASVQKYQGSGGRREGAGAPKGNKNAQKQADNKNNQINQINQNNQIFQTQQTETETETKNRKKENIKKKKISFDDVSDWNDLMIYWEENKRGGKYKSDDSRERMLERLKCLTGNDFNFAKQAICHCIDNGYQGFCNGNELYYKGKKPQWKTIDEKPNAYEEFSLAVEEMKRRVS